MEAKNKTHTAECGEDDAEETLQPPTSLVPPESGSNAESSGAEHDAKRAILPPNPHQASTHSPAAEEDATSAVPIQTLGSDASEKLVNGVTSPSEPPKCRKWKRTFHMVIHLANGDNATRVTCLDTGAAIDVISIDVVNKLRLAKEKYQGPPLKPIAGTYLPQWQVTFDWHVAKFQKTYTSTFAVLDEDHSADFDILLGKKTVEDIVFYRVNEEVWFVPTNDELDLNIGRDDAKHSLPSIEVDM
ncbi:MAG: hypothetical protein Q9226_001710 [Calogaya cf. arnoldii]